MRGINLKHMRCNYTQLHSLFITFRKWNVVPLFTTKLNYKVNDCLLFLVFHVDVQLFLNIRSKSRPEPTLTLLLLIFIFIKRSISNITTFTFLDFDN